MSRYLCLGRCQCPASWVWLTQIQSACRSLLFQQFCAVSHPRQNPGSSAETSLMETHHIISLGFCFEEMVGGRMELWIKHLIISTFLICVSLSPNNTVMTVYTVQKEVKTHFDVVFVEHVTACWSGVAKRPVSGT